MNLNPLVVLVLMVLLAQGLILKSTYFPTVKAPSSEALTLTPEVKAYIESRISGGSPEDLGRLLKKVSDLENEAARLEYLRSTVQALEEGQAHLGKLAYESSLGSVDVLAPARERELQKFRTGLEQICARSLAPTEGGISGSPANRNSKRSNPSATDPSSDSATPPSAAPEPSSPPSPSSEP